MAVDTSVKIEERKKAQIKPGNTVRVWQKISEKGKTRLQAFEGLVIAHKHGFEQGATFTVRKIFQGVGVERIFPLFSPIIDKIELIKSAKARRAKLYYVREKTAKQIRKKMKELKGEAKAKAEAKLKALEEELKVAKASEKEEAEKVKEIAEKEAEANVEEVKEEKAEEVAENKPEEAEVPAEEPAEKTEESEEQSN